MVNYQIPTGFNHYNSDHIKIKLWLYTHFLIPIHKYCQLLFYVNTEYDIIDHLPKDNTSVYQFQCTILETLLATFLTSLP